MAFNLFKYKTDQGRFARGVAFWLLTALSFYGCTTLYSFLLGWSWPSAKLISAPIPIINSPLNSAFIISVVVFLLAVKVILSWFIYRPKMTDLLIETETEMKKVTWPSWNDAFNSSVVVIAGMIFFMILLGMSDYLMNKFFSYIVFR